MSADFRSIGLTGSIAGGKTTVLAMLAEMGLRTASSDAVAKEVFALDEVQSALAARTGLPPPLSPKDLREAMVRDASLRRWVNRLMHPLVGERTALLEVDVIEVPLLYEACLQGRYREVWVVACGQEERERRLRARYGPEVDVNAYGRWQLDEKVKISLGDVVVRTDSPSRSVLEFLRTEVARSFPGRIAQPG